MTDKDKFQKAFIDLPTENLLAELKALREQVIQFGETIEFCRDKAAETPEISKSNRAGKALSDIRDRCIVTLSEQSKR